MSQKIEKLNIRPKASIYEMFARLNYKTWYAIAEFVDNSTASFLKHKRSLKLNKINDVHIEITYDEQKNTLKIVDDAYGMDREEFRKAILLDAKPIEKNSRNEFGKGLKTAASWFGEVWHVKSTRFGNNEMFETTVDIPYLKENNLDDVTIISYPTDSNSHGTEIFIEKLTKNMAGGNTKKKIKAVLSSMYRRDLDSGHVHIKFNGESLKFKPYQVLSKGGHECRKNIDFKFKFLEKEYRVTGFVGILGGSDSGYTKAGFALFRNDRVVIGSEGEYYKPLQIFKQAQSTISHKLFGEINLEDFEINQAKDGFLWDGGLEEEFINSLKHEIQDYINIANLTIKVRDSDEINHSREVISEVKNEAQKNFSSIFNDEDKIPKTGNEEVDNFTDVFIKIKTRKKKYSKILNIYIMLESINLICLK